MELMAATVESMKAATVEQLLDVMDRSQRMAEYPQYVKAIQEAGRWEEWLEHYRLVRKGKANQRKAGKCAVTKAHTRKEREYLESLPEGRRWLNAKKAHDSATCYWQKGRLTRERFDEAAAELRAAKKALDFRRAANDWNPDFQETRLLSPGEKPRCVHDVYQTVAVGEALTAERVHGTPYVVNHCRQEGIPIIGAYRDGIVGKSASSADACITLIDNDGDDHFHIFFGKDHQASRRARQLIWCIGNGRPLRISHEALSEWIVNGTIPADNERISATAAQKHI